jgi:hypothetical protein
VNWFRWLWWDGGSSGEGENVYAEWTSTTTYTTSFTAVVRYPISQPSSGGGSVSGGRRRKDRSIWRALNFWPFKAKEKPTKIYAEVAVQEDKYKVSFRAYTKTHGKLTTKTLNTVTLSAVVLQKTSITSHSFTPKVKISAKVVYDTQDEDLSEEELMILLSI